MKERIMNKAYGPTGYVNPKEYQPIVSIAFNMNEERYRELQALCNIDNCEPKSIINNLIKIRYEQEKEAGRLL